METAQDLIESLQKDVRIVVPKKKGWTNRSSADQAQLKIDERLLEWTGRLDRPVRTLLFVGHHPSHLGMARVAGLDMQGIAEKGHGAVIVCKRVSGRWELDADLAAERLR